MILRFALVTAVIGFIDSMLGITAFIYLNVEEYRHRKFGSPLEVKWSYITASFGFVKGLALCIPAAQVMVNKKKALIGRWACVLWFVLTVIQVGLIAELVWFYFYPSKTFIVSDIFLTTVRIVHAVVLLISLILVFLFWNEMGQLLPPKPPRAPPKPKAPKKVKAAKRGKNQAAAHADNNAPQNGGENGDGNDSD